MGIPLPLSSVPAVNPYIQYTSASGQTVFPYPFPITQDSDLVVVINGVTQATDSGYTLSGQGNSTGGNVTFTSGQTSGTIITLYRNVAIQRLTQINQNSGFSSTAFNAEYNNIYLIMQQLQEAIGFCLQLPNTNSPTPVTTLAPALFANALLGFDAFGNPTPMSFAAVFGPGNNILLAPSAGVTLTVNTSPAAATGEAIAITTSAARGSGQDYIQFNDPSGVKGTVGYINLVNDDFVLQNAMNSTFRLYNHSHDVLDIGPNGNVTINAPTTGSALTVTASGTNSGAGDIQITGSLNRSLGHWVQNLSTGIAASTSINLVGSNSAHSLFAAYLSPSNTATPLTGGVTGEQAYLTTFGAVSLALGVNSIEVMRFGTAGNVTIDAPTSGSALTVTASTTNSGAGDIQITGSLNRSLGHWVQNLSTGVAASTSLNLVGSNSAHSLFAAYLSPSNTATPLTGGLTGEQAYISTFGAVALAFGVNSIEVMRLGTAGNITVDAPSSGVALTVNTSAAAGTGEALALTTGVARGSGQNYIQFNDPTGVKGTVGYIHLIDDDFIIQNALSSTFRIFNHGSDCLDISSGGAVTIAAPSSGNALNLPAGAVGTPAITFGGDTTSGFYQIAANRIGLALSGTLNLDMQNTIWQLLGCNLTLTAPPSGSTLTVNGAAGSTSMIINAHTNTEGLQINGAGSASALVVLGTTSGVQLQVTGNSAGAAAIGIATCATTGAQTATFSASNKPGSGTTAPSNWLPVKLDGTLYYIPCWQ